MTTLRVLILAFGALLVVSGFATIAVGGWIALWGFWLVVSGLVIVGAVVLERRRYRSSVADTGPDPIGPGGGEPLDAPLDARFRPTTERFVDPTTGVPMRVWIDTDSGERRYRAEG